MSTAVAESVELETPPARFYFALGLTPGAPETEVVLAYRELLERPGLDPRSCHDAEAAHAILRNWFHRCQPPVTLGTGKKRRRSTQGDQDDGERPTRTRRGRGRNSLSQPPVWYFRTLGLTPLATAADLPVAAERVGRALAGDPEEARLRVDAIRAANVLRSYFGRRAKHERRLAREAQQAQAGQRRGEAPEATKETNPQVAHYLSLFGLQPGPTRMQLEDAYEVLLAATASNSDAPALRRRTQARHAFRVLRRILRERRRREATRVLAQAQARVRVRAWLVLPALALLVLAVNAPRLRTIGYSLDPGDVVSQRKGGAEFGTVVAFDPAHRFDRGADKTVPAYEIKLAGTTEKTWVTKQFAMDGLFVLESGPPPGPAPSTGAASVSIPTTAPQPPAAGDAEAGADGEQSRVSANSEVR